MALIEKEPIIQFIEDGLNNPDKKKAFGYDAIEILSEIEYAPTVDAVTVVRCKDCKSAYINSFSAASGVAVCRRWSNAEKTIVVQHDDFCSYGERRQGE